jgi:hypothetical protein
MSSRAAHRQELVAALESEAEAQRLILAGEQEQAARAFRAAAERYRSSWELASPTSYGRLVGYLKASILAGGGQEEAGYVAAQLAGASAESPTAAYARALAALLAGDDEAATRWASLTRRGSDAFGRAADAAAALAQHDSASYQRALEAIIRDFERRSAHLTGVAIADTAMMLERLAQRRGMSASVASPLLPPLAAAKPRNDAPREARAAGRAHKRG